MNAQHLSNFQIIDEAGTTWQIWDGSPAYFQLLDGAGLAPVRRITQGSPLQHGVTDKGFRLEPRKMSLALQIQGTSESDADSKQDSLAYIFGPTNNALKLRATRLDGGVRQIDCYTDGALDFPMSKRMGAMQEVIVPLVAPDPIWYDPLQQSSNVFMPTSATYQISLSASGLTWEDWPVLSIIGPATGLTISHLYSGDSIVFSSAIPAGETFVIDLRPGQKTVYRSSDGANRISYLNAASLSALGALRIYPEKWLKLLNGSATNNIITAAATGTSGATKLTVDWYKRYISL